MAALRLVFMGSDPIALPLLDWLDGVPEVAQVVAVFTQPDRPAGRGQRAQPNGIKRWAEARGLAVRQPEKLGPEDEAALRAWQPDAALVMAYGHILRESLLSIPRLGTLNLHASILPAYRGASPIQTAVATGERETGVSLMRIVRRLDAGPVADVERVAIGPADTSEVVEERLSAACVPLLARTLPRLGEGTLAFAEQDESRATYCRKLTKADGALDFAADARALAARVNGLFPWPGCGAAAGADWLRFGCAVGLPAASEPAGFEPGAVVRASEEGLEIAAGGGRLRVLRLQRPGGRMLPAGEFLRGFPLSIGHRFPSLPMPPLVAPRPFKH